MNYVESYCSKKGITHESMVELLKSPLIDLLKDFVAKSQEIGNAELIRCYDTNVVHTLRGELRALTVLGNTLQNLKDFSERKTSEPPPKPIDELTDPLFQKYKEEIKIQ